MALANIAMEKIRTLLLLWVVGLTTCQRLKRLENRIDLVETRQDMESMTRREEFASILERLDIIESLLNKSSGTQINPDIGNEIMPRDEMNNSVTMVKESFEVLLKAFDDEKKMNSRLRRQVSSFKNSVEEIKLTLTNTSQNVRTLIATVVTREDATQMFKNVNSVCSASLEPSNLKAVLLEALLDQSRIAHDRNVGQLKIDLENKVDLINTSISKSLNRAIEVMEDISFSRFKSCSDISMSGETKSGIYTVYPRHGYSPKRVYCDMVSEGGGWTVFQRRQDGSQDFNKDWATYKSGFGDINGEFWLGNEMVSIMTKDCCHELRIDLTDFKGNRAVIRYGAFRVFPEDEHYKLLVDEYLPELSNKTVGDSLSHHNNISFSTKDKDLDDYDHGHCAKHNYSGWWFTKCYNTNLNGIYRHNKLNSTEDETGLTWNTWNSGYYLLKESEMKFRKILKT